MTKIAVVYHSGFGHTKVVAEHVAKGARTVPESEVTMVAVGELAPPGNDGGLGGRWSVLHEADAMIFGSPTYMGGVSARFKEFMDHTGGIWGDQAWRDKVAAGFTNSGSLSGDNGVAIHSLQVFACQHSMVWVSAGVMPGRHGPGEARGLNRLGGYSGLLTQSDDASPGDTPPQSDRETAEEFGARVAAATARWMRGRG